MNLEEDILDNPQLSKPRGGKFKSRVPSDLMIVVGIVHILVGLYAFYLFSDTLTTIWRWAEASGEVQNAGWIFRWIVLQSFPLIYGIVLVIAGFGLVRHKIRGWIYALGAAVFGILLPLLKIAMIVYLPGIVWSVSDLFAFFFLLFFALSFVFLISKTIRNFYQPSMRSYGIVGIIVLILALDFMLTPLLYLRIILMNHEEIIDNEKDLDDAVKVFDSRSARNILIFIAILFILFGTGFLLITMNDVYSVLEYTFTNESFASSFIWGKWLLSKSLGMFYIVSFILGGIGLLRRKKVGWIVSLTAALSAILNIVIIVIKVGFPSTRDYGFFGWILFAILVFFALIIFFLLSKPIRKFFQPSLKSFGIVGILTCAFIILLMTVILWV